MDIPWVDHKLVYTAIADWDIYSEPAPQHRNRVCPPEKILKRNFKNLTPSTFRKMWFPCTRHDLHIVELDAIFHAKLCMVRNVLCPLHEVRIKSKTHLKNKWFNTSLKKVRGEVRKFARKWRKTKALHDHQIYLAHLRRYKLAMKISKKTYVQTQINKATNSTKALFSITKILSSNEETTKFSPSNPLAYCEKVASFFSQKVASLREKVDQDVQRPEVQEAQLLLHTWHAGKESWRDESMLGSPTVKSKDMSPVLTSFAPLSHEETRRILSKMSPASSDLDPLPTSIMKNLGEEILLDLSHLVNCSFNVGIVPEAWKQGLVTPLLKKVGTDQDDPKNLRPVSQLRILPRIAEAAVTPRLQKHIEQNNLLHDLQSGFRPGRGTEIAVADIREKVLWQVDRSHPVLLVLLDLSAAFDTVDHSILVQRLREVGRIEGIALDWLDSFLSERSQAIKWGEARSSFTAVPHGVPQGSALSPLLFNIYLRPLATLLEQVGLRFQMYVDDVQLLVDLHEDAQEAEKLVPCLALIEEWMRVNKLCLNSAKTELLLFEGQRNTPTPAIPWPPSWGTAPTPVKHTRDLGMILSHALDGAAHAAATAKAGHHHLNSLSRLFPLLTLQQKKLMYQAMVGSRLNYGLVLLLGASKKSLFKLQKVQNRAIRLIFGLKRQEHLSQWRIKLNWLTILDQLKLKLCVWLRNAYGKGGPLYTHNWARHPTAARSRRPPQGGQLALPRIRKSRKGGGTIAFRGASFWNNLPLKLRTWQTAGTFKAALKSHLMEQERNRVSSQNQCKAALTQSTFTQKESSSTGLEPTPALPLDLAHGLEALALLPPSSALSRSPPRLQPPSRLQPLVRGLRSPSPIRRNIDSMALRAQVNKVANTRRDGIYQPRTLIT